MGTVRKALWYSCSIGLGIFPMLVWVMPSFGVVMPSTELCPCESKHLCGNKVNVLLENRKKRDGCVSSILSVF